MKDTISKIKVAGYDQIDSNGNSTAVDRQGFEGVLFVGAVSTADTAGLRLTESDELAGTYTDVASNLQYGNLDVIAAGDTFKVGYVGYKRYVRLETDASAGSVVDVVTNLTPANDAPQA